MPVTTVPKPETVKTRSMGRRGRLRSRFAWVADEGVFDRAQEVVEAVLGRRGAAHERRSGEAGRRRQVFDFRRHQVQPFGVCEVALGDHEDAALDAEQVEDRQVLARLRHHAFVGGDDQHGEVDAADAGEHVLDEVLVAGHVDDADLFAARQLQPGEAEVDGHAPVLLLLQAVRVDAGQGVHERGLAVVDVAGGADDEHSESF